MAKSPDAFRTISEVAEWLDVPTHVLRFWESRFTQIKPVKRAGGRRYYRPADMELIGGIKRLLHDDGLTIRGVQKLLREEGVRHVAVLSPALDDPGANDADATSKVVHLDPKSPAEAPDRWPFVDDETPGAAPENDSTAATPPETDADPVADMAGTPVAEDDRTDIVAALPQETTEEGRGIEVEPQPIAVPETTDVPVEAIPVDEAPAEQAAPVAAPPSERSPVQPALAEDEVTPAPTIVAPLLRVRRQALMGQSEMLDALLDRAQSLANAMDRHHD